MHERVVVWEGITWRIYRGDSEGNTVTERRVRERERNGGAGNRRYIYRTINLYHS